MNEGPSGADERTTLWAMGVLIAVIGSLAHEWLGHGLACIAAGGRVTLMTFLVFRCDGATAFTDAAGPLGAVLVGVLALIAAAIWPRRMATARLFCLMLGAILLFWASAQVVREAIDRTDDWGHVAAALHWPPLWQPVVGLIGVAAYFITARIVGRQAAMLAAGRPERVRQPWLAAATAAVVLAGLWRGGGGASALDALLTFGVAPFALFFIARALERSGTPAGTPVPRNIPLIVLAVVAFGGFATIVAPGLGTLSHANVSPR